MEGALEILLRLKGIMGQTRKSSTLQAAVVAEPSTPESAEKTNRALQLALAKHLNTFPITGKESFREASKALTEQHLLNNIKSFDTNQKRTSWRRPQAEAVSRFLGLLERSMASLLTGIQANPDISAIVVGCVCVVIALAVQSTTFSPNLRNPVLLRWFPRTSN